VAAAAEAPPHASVDRVWALPDGHAEKPSHVLQSFGLLGLMIQKALASRTITTTADAPQ
jgi:hypothetical protein